MFPKVHCSGVGDKIAGISRPSCTQDLSSLTRDLTCTSALEALSLNPWTTREVPRILDIDMYHEKKIMEGDESMFLGAEGTATVENLARHGVTETVTLEWRPKVREGLGQAEGRVV